MAISCFFMKRFLIALLATLALPTAINAELNNDYILKVNQSKKLFIERKFSEMTKICNELIEISPDNPNGYVCKGLALGFNMENPKKREALRNFTKAIKINPENYDAYFFRGALKFGMRRRKDLGFSRAACDDMEKAYLNNQPFALEYVKENKSMLQAECGSYILK